MASAIGWGVAAAILLLAAWLLLRCLKLVRSLVRWRRRRHQPPPPPQWVPPQVADQLNQPSEQKGKSWLS